MPSYEDEVEAWRKGRHERLVAENGWLTLVQKQLIFPGENAITVEGRTVARTWLEGDEVRTEPLPDAGGLRFETLRRGVETYVRVRDPNAKARREFAGVPHFPVDRKWCIDARLEPYARHKVIDMPYEGGYSERFESPGRAVFEAFGVTYAVEPVFDHGTPRLYLLFRDATFRDSTYGAGRFLYADLPKDGRVTLDFNRAFNPPCAFTPFASCPLTPEENKLPIRIEAGEKRP
jgi:uncharacterized protein (DUF1684 family)